MFLSLADRDKAAGIAAARRFAELGFALVATAGHGRGAARPRASRVDAVVAKVGEGDVGLDAVDLISSGKVDLVINTPRGQGPRADGAHIRRAATVPRRAVRHHRRGGPGRGVGHGRVGDP